MAHVEIRLFGSLSLTADGQQIASLQGRMCRDLLSYLLLRHDVPLSREYLAALFWGNRDSVHARHCFNTALWRLQAALGGKDSPAWRCLRIDAQTISFCPDTAVFVDSIAFEQYCALADGWSSAEEDQRAAVRRDAVALYRGDLLADCYEEWCLTERERLQRIYIRALQHLVHYHRRRGEFDEAIDAARRILASDPLREEVHRELILLYLDARQPAAALQQYRTCANLLNQELHAAPVPETSLLLQRILQLQRQEASPSGLTDAITATAQLPKAPSEIDDPYPMVSELVVQICRQLRDIATGIETVVARLATQPASRVGTEVFSHNDNYNEVLMEIQTRLEPIAAAVQIGATGRQPRPLAAYTSPPSAQSA